MDVGWAHGSRSAAPLKWCRLQCRPANELVSIAGSLQIALREGTGH